jgi:hypothetical protein
MAQAADFFVSYTSTDRAWAEWIAWQLEGEGYTVVLQAWDFTAGRDWAHEMQHAPTATCAVTFAPTSAAASYVRSPPRWCCAGNRSWRASSATVG